MTDTAASGGAMVQVRNLRVQFGSLVAVNDICFDLRAGDLLGLIGPNGAGKTTLLRAMACLQPAEGEVRIIGEVVKPGATEVLRHIGFTPDNPPVYEEVIVRKFLQFIARGSDMVG